MLSHLFVLIANPQSLYQTWEFHWKIFCNVSIVTPEIRYNFRKRN